MLVSIDTGPLISVIIPVYNSDEYIERTIRSVLNQTYVNFEIIAVDDCSSDSSYQVLHRLSASEEKMTCYQLDRNSGGPAAPRNLGIDRSKGEYLSFLDSDDEWSPTKLETQINEMTSEGLDFSSMRVATLDQYNLNENSLEKWSAAGGCSIQQLNLVSLLKKNTIVTSSVLVKRDMIGNFRFSTNQEHVAVEDYLMWLQLHQSHEIVSAILPQRLVFYRVRDGSISRVKLPMALKVYKILDTIKIDNRRLGVRKWWYFLHYIIYGMLQKTYR